MPITQASRKDDKIEHTWADVGATVGFVAGALIGAVACAALALTGVGALVLVGSAGVLGSGASEWGSKTYIDKHEAGDIQTGSPDVFIGSDGRNAAYVGSEVKCHSETIISGCETITINTKYAARVGEITKCDGSVKTGCETVLYGGPSIQVESKRWSGELPAWFWWSREAVDIATFVYGFPKHILDPTKWQSAATAIDKLKLLDDAFGVALTVFDKGLGYGAGIAEQLGNHELAQKLSAISDNAVYKTIGIGYGLHGARKGYLGELETQHPPTPTPPDPGDFVGPPRPPPEPPPLPPPDPPPLPPPEPPPPALPPPEPPPPALPPPEPPPPALPPPEPPPPALPPPEPPPPALPPPEPPPGGTGS